MILSKESIEYHVNEDIIGVTPPVKPEQYQPASLDLRIGETTYHVGDDTYHKGINLAPGEFRLGHTQEYITMPNHLAALVTGRSSIGRDGLMVHSVAGWIDPGFEGQITLELKNLADDYLSYYAGKRICQIIFIELDAPTDPYDGKYQGQMGPRK